MGKQKGFLSSVGKRPRAKNEDDDLTARPRRRDDAGSDGYDHDDEDGNNELEDQMKDVFNEDGDDL